MAQFFPARTACRFDSSGERRLAERLEKKLEDDYLCWFNIPVGPKALQPDFVVLHPQRGVGVFQGSCRVDRVFYAASSSAGCSRSGLSMTAPLGSQLRVLPDQRLG